MELIRYLDLHFHTRDQLLAHAGITAAQLEDLQQRRMMPLPSYRLRLDLACDSFFGPHSASERLDYYARGYVAWIREVLALGDPDEARSLFARRYRVRIAQLAAAGLAPAGRRLDDDAHVAAEWEHFLAGTYGLCTVSGLPEDIAAKEAAIVVIRETIESERALTVEENELLCRAVGVLDNASAAFAPHEVARSSRRRYIDDVRAAYRL